MQTAAIACRSAVNRYLPPPQAPRVACGRSVDAADAADASIRLRTRGRSDMENGAHKYPCRRTRPSSPCEGKDCPIVI